MASSTNAARTFNKVSEVAGLGVPQLLPANYSWPSQVSTAFDQATLPNPNINLVRMARTNGYPSACVGSDGVLRIAFSKRIPQPGAPAGMRVRPNHLRHAQRKQLVERADRQSCRVPGHQFQPAIACTGTRATAIWYDQRGDAAFSTPLLPWVFFPFIVEPLSPPPSHTVDVRAVQTDASGDVPAGLVHSGLEVSAGVQHGLAGVRAAAIQLPQLCPVRGRPGPVPGDYLEAVPKNPFTPPLCANAACTQMTGWAFNTFANESPLVHGLWTDNRDVLQLSEGRRSRTSTGPITSRLAPRARRKPALTWTRNQNLYTSLLGGGFVLQAEGNARRTEGSREARICRAAAEPGAAGRGPERDAQEALQADLRRAERGSVVQLRHRLHQSIGGGVPCHLRPRGQSRGEHDLRRRAVRVGAVRTVFVRKDSTAPVVVDRRGSACLRERRLAHSDR